MDQDWQDLAYLAGAVIEQPSLFAIGEHDSSRAWLADTITQHEQTLPGLITNEVMPGLGHWLQREDATQTN